MAMSLEDIKKNSAAGKSSGKFSLSDIKSGTAVKSEPSVLESAGRLGSAYMSGIPGVVSEIASGKALDDIKTVGSKAVDLAKKTAGIAGEEIQKGAETLGTRADQFGVAESPVEKAAVVYRTPLDATGIAARVIFSPITAALGDIIDAVSDMPEVQRVAMNDNIGKILDAAGSVGKSLDQIAKEHPDVASTVKDVVDTLSLAVGPKGVKVGSGLAERTAAATERVVSRAAEPVVSTFSRTAERVLPKLTQAAKDSDEILKVSTRATGPEVAATFAKYGIEAPVSAVTGSRSIQAAEGALQSAWFGGSKITRIVENAQKGIAKVAESLTKRVDPEDLRTSGVTAGGVGETLQKSLTRIREEFNAAKDKLYTEAEGSIGSQQAKLTETRNTLSDIIAQKGASLAPESAIQVKYFQRMLNNMSTAEKRTFKNIKATRTEIGKKLKNPTDPITSGDRGNLKRLYASLSRDLDATVIGSGSEAANALKAADAFYKAGINKVNSFVGRTIFNARNPELIFEKLIKPGDITTVQELKALLGAEDFRQISSLFMNNMIERSLVLGRLNVKKLITLMEKYGDAQIREIVGDRGLQQLKDFRSQSIVNDIVEKATNADGNILPATLAREVEKYGDDLLKNAMQPEAYQKLQDVYKLADSMKAGTKIVLGSPTFEKFQIGFNALLFGTNIPVLLTKLALEFGATKLFTTSWGKKMLTGGAIGGKSKLPAEAVKAAEEASEATSAIKTSPALPQEPQAGPVTRYSESNAPVSRETPPVRTPTEQQTK